MQGWADLAAVAKTGCVGTTQVGSAHNRAQGPYGAVHGGCSLRGMVVEGTGALGVCALVGMLSQYLRTTRSQQ